MQVNRPNVYYNTPNIDNPNLKTLIAGTETTTNTSEFDFQIDGFNWKYFTKNRHYNVILWDDIVAVGLQSDLKVQSWGRPFLPSNCSKQFKVYNVKDTQIDNQVYWPEHDNHAKWATSDTYMCFGDMNRMESQASRGGGALCFNNEELLKTMESMIYATDPCEGEDFWMKVFDFLLELLG